MMSRMMGIKVNSLEILLHKDNKIHWVILNNSKINNKINGIIHHLTNNSKNKLACHYNKTNNNKDH
jgi:hypothetical protein